MGNKNSGRRKGALNKEIKEVNGVPSKVCVGPICNGEYAAVSDFGKSKSYCLTCQKKREINAREANYIAYKLKEIYRHTKERMKKGKVYEIDPNLKSVLEQLSTKQKHCYYSGVQLVEKVNNPNSWSIDRKNFNGGYVKDNIVLCTTLVNRVKGSIEFNFEKLVETYGEEIALRAFKNIIMTVLKNRKEVVN